MTTYYDHVPDYTDYVIEFAKPEYRTYRNLGMMVLEDSSGFTAHCELGYSGPHKDRDSVVADLESYIDVCLAPSRILSRNG